MNYHQFICAVEKTIQHEVKSNVTVCVCSAEKNNGIIRKGIALKEENFSISPTVYLEEYYKKYKEGQTIENIVRDILRLCKEIPFRDSLESDRISCYDSIKEKIIYRLINRKANEKRLKHMPFVPYLDLAVVFCVLLEVSQYTTATMMIQKNHLEFWQVTEEEVYEQACRNTPRLLPDEFMTMGAVLENLSGNAFTDEGDLLYVLSNRMRSFGAAALLYPGRLESIGQYLGDNFFVLPSSVHEVIVVREKDAGEKEILSEMVAEVNRTQVDPEEVLSDVAYYYSREEGKLIL